MTLNELLARLERRDATVCVVGQGYVGLSVACGAASAGMRVAAVATSRPNVVKL